MIQINRIDSEDEITLVRELLLEYGRIRNFDEALGDYDFEIANLPVRVNSFKPNSFNSDSDNSKFCPSESIGISNRLVCSNISLVLLIFI